MGKQQFAARCKQSMAAMLLATCCAGSAGAATPPLPAQLPLSFEHLEPFGADSQSTLSLAQDQRGFIWIGTLEGGLFRYDGRMALRYSNDPANPASLPGGRIATLFSDPQGRLWVGSDEGLARYDPLHNSFVRYAPPSSSANQRIIRRIISDGGRGLWLATWGGLQHFDPETARFELLGAPAQQSDALAQHDVNAVALDRQGGLWAATWPAGIDYRRPGQNGFVHLRVDAPEQADTRLNDVRALHVDQHGTLWIGTDGGVLTLAQGAPWTQRQRVAGPASRINHISADASGTVWIATRAEGLLRWDGARQRFQSYVHRAEDGRSLPSNAINAVMEDRSGTLWVGTFTDGVSRANMGLYGFERLVPRDIAPDSFPSSNFIRALGAAPDGQLWLGTDNGLALLDPGSRRLLRKFTAAPGQPGALSHNSIYSLYQQGNATLWIGTSKGLNRYDAASGRFSAVPYARPPEGFINTIAAAGDHALWVGTAGGLLHYDTASGAQRLYRHDPADAGSRSVDDTSSVLQDSQGRLWVGDFFRAGGLDLMPRPGAPFQHFRHQRDVATSLNSDKISCLFEDMYGTIWIGTARGLHRMVPDAQGQPSFQRYLEHGAPGPILIEAIHSDSSGILWISSVRGLSRLDPSSGNFTHYGTDDGLTDGMYMGAVARSSDGKLYFGSSTGISAVHPGRPLRAPDAPQVSLTDIRILDKSLTSNRLPDVQLDGPVFAPRALTLPWSAAVLTLEFAALHYAAPRRTTYAYMLEGFDQRWVEVSAAQPVATYTNLDPGAYRFLLRATSNKGLSSSVLVLPISITPPLWKTWWFRLGAVLLSVLAMVMAYRARVRAFKRRQRRLEMLVAQRTQALQESNRRLTALSSTDALTGLANRRSFDDILAREWARAKRQQEPLALAMIDVDFFKPYNDHYGHQQGDACLQRVAQVLADTIQRGTDLSARYGGEEFAFIAPATASSDALVIAERMRATLEALALPHAKAPLQRITVSIGLAVVVPGEQQEAAQLLRRADQALYQAKRQGRNRVLLAPELLAPERLPAAQPAPDSDPASGTP